jgi:hypothetical protein
VRPDTSAAPRLVTAGSPPPAPPPSRPVLTGALSQLSVPELLQTAENGRRSGVIRLLSRDRKGSFWLRQGRIVDAAIDGGTRGREAVYAMAFWNEGTFEAAFGEIQAEDRIGEPTSALLLEAMRLHDEASRNGELPHAALLDPPPAPPAPVLALHRGLTLLNIAASSALAAAELAVVVSRLESTRGKLLPIEPALAVFSVRDDGAIVAAGGLEPTAVDPVVRAVTTWVTAFYAAMDYAFPGRFTVRQLARASAAIAEDLAILGFHRALGLDEASKLFKEQE